MKTYLKYSLLLLTFVAFTACGGGENEEQPAEAEVVETDVRTIDIIGTDNMKFVVMEAEEGLRTGGQSGEFVLLEGIEASPGEELRITLRTVSNMPPQAMSHNLALLEMGTDGQAFANAALQHRDNEYISPDYEDRVIAATAMLGNGESDTITFNAPSEPGEYTYICSFPGHYSGGMVGTLIVE